VLGAWRTEMCITRCARGQLIEAAYYLRKANDLKLHLNKEDIFAFGDSHVSFCFDGIPRCKTHWMGPITMHRVGRDKLNVLDLRNWGVSNQTAIVFIFGEIDARAHVGEQQARQNATIEEITDTPSKNYIETIRLNKENFPDIKFFVCSVLPPLTSLGSSELPFSTPTRERVEIVKTINNKLKKLCSSGNIETELIYLDIHQYFSDSSGLMIRELSDNVVHVNRDLSDIIEYEIEKFL